MYRHFKNGFYVNDKGKVKRIRNHKVVEVDIYSNKYGYNYFILFNSHDKEKVYIHRAVAKLFIPNNDKSRYIVDHTNKNRTDNQVSNLRLVNASENMINRHSWWL